MEQFVPFQHEFIEQQFPKEPPIIPEPKPAVIKVGLTFRYFDFAKSGSSWATTWKDEEEIREEFWYPNLDDAKLIFDVGCDVGSYTMPALALNKPYVVAITPENFNEFRCNLVLNGWYDPNRVLPVDAAFYDKPGYLEFQMQHFSLNPAANHYRVYKMDDAFLDMNTIPIDIMKIDVEGAEMQVLMGARNMIIRDHPKLLIECHTFKEPGIDEAVVNYLTGLGLEYQFKRAGHHATSFVYAYREDGTEKN